MIPMPFVPSFVVALALTPVLTEDPQPAPPLPRPSPEQLAWHELELGMFVHLAPQTWQDSETDDLSTPLSAIDPSALDTDQWVDVATSMGAKYLVFVAKHEGGFCWWPTETTDFCVKNTPWRGGKGDVLADLAASCRRAGIGLGVYLSPRDGKHGVDVGGKARDPAQQSVYEAMFRRQLEEVLSTYGPMMEVWFDGSLVFDVGDVLAKHAPHAVAFQGPQATIRWVGNEDGVAPDGAWNAVRAGAKKWGDFTAAESDADGDRWLPIECDARIRSTWFWKTGNEKTLKSVDALVEMYEKSVGRGAVLLLNHTPDRTGRIPAADAARAAEFGAEIRRRFESPLAETSGEGRTLSIAFGTPARIDRVELAEEIAHGERVRKWVVEGEVDGAWRELARGTAIGHRRIEPVAPVTVSALRWRCEKSARDLEPRIRRFAAYDTASK